MRRPTRNRIVWIKWHDAVSDTTRATDEGLRGTELAVNENIGWIAHENEQRIVLAHGLSTSGEVDHITIPTNAIIERMKVCPAATKGK